MSSSLMMDVDERKVEANMKPECAISSGYDPIKNEEETDDEELSDKDINTSNVQPINIKEEAVKVELKTEDDISTDDERSPEYVLSSGYNPVKSEKETDEELDDEDTNTINRPIKNERKELERRRKSPRLLTIPTTQSNAIQDNMDVQHKTRKRRYSCKRKRVEEESYESVRKAARIVCSVEGCNRKAADSGTCKAEHKGYYYCKEDGCTNAAQNGGVCRRHTESAIDKKAARVECSVEGCTRKAADNGRCSRKHGGYNLCSQEGCTNRARGREGVCVRHGASWTRKTCSHEGCTNFTQKGGLCARHGAVKSIKICSHEGCTKQSRKGGVCARHYNLLNWGT